jgi:SPP1 gp7 family putative phage head morphogenesis protein
MEQTRMVLLSRLNPSSSDLGNAIYEDIIKAVPGVDPAHAGRLALAGAGDLVAGITSSQRKALRRLTARALVDGWTQGELADRIAASVGLDERGVNAVENFRRGLVAGGTPKGIARQRANDYAKRLRASRAATIARTELARLTADAKREMWAQWKKDGKIDQYAVRVWHTHKDERMCPVCQPMNGQRAAIGKPYMKGMTGPPVHPNCRCHETLERGQVVLGKEVKDGDGDGWVDDGKPTMRPTFKTGSVIDFDGPLGATWRNHYKQQAAIKAFDELPDDAMVVVYHGTTEDNADLLTEGTEVAETGDRDKKLGGKSKGLYIAPTYDDAATYGDYVVSFKVPKGVIMPSDEARGYSAGKAFMNTSAGAVIEPGFVLPRVTVRKPAVQKLDITFKYRHLVR